MYFVLLGFGSSHADLEKTRLCVSQLNVITDEQSQAAATSVSGNHGHKHFHVCVRGGAGGGGGGGGV